MKVRLAKPACSALTGRQFLTDGYSVTTACSELKTMACSELMQMVCSELMQMVCSELKKTVCSELKLPVCWLKTASKL